MSTLTGYLNLAIYATVLTTKLEVAGVMIASMTICSGAAITWGVLEGKSTKTINRLAFIGTASGFVLGIPLTICAAVLVSGH